MRKVLVVLAVALVSAMTLAAQVKNGPIVDKVIFDVRMDQTIGVKDTAEGNTDLFIQGLDGRTFQAINEADRAKLDTYTVPSTWWSLQMNPVPNKAPYQVTSKDGKVSFNPFAIREVRYALNWLVDRQRIVDEILLGVGMPMLTPMTPGQPGTYKYNLIAAKQGHHPPRQREKGPHRHRQRHERRRQAAPERGQAREDRRVLELERRAHLHQVPHPRR